MDNHDRTADEIETEEVVIDGEKLERLRELRGYSQGQLAIKTGKTQSYISRLIRGERTNVSLRVAMLLADALQVHVNSLLRRPTRIGVTGDWRASLYGNLPDVETEEEAIAVIETILTQHARARRAHIVQRRTGAAAYEEKDTNAEAEREE